MSAFEIGQAVKINNISSMFHEARGVVIRENYTTPEGEWVRVDFGLPHERDIPCRPAELVRLRTKQVAP